MCTLSLVTLGLIPSSYAVETHVAATLEDSSGTVLGAYEAASKMKGIIHLIFLPVGPVNGCLVQRGNEEDLIKSICGQMQRDEALKQKLSPPKEP